LHPKVRSPLDEFVRANSKKVGTDPTFSQQIFSLTNHTAKICFSKGFNAPYFAILLGLTPDDFTRQGESAATRWLTFMLL
jgi:hypothetical protein